MNDGSVSSEWARLNVATLAKEGLESRALCEASDINYDDLGCPGVRFSKEVMNRLWENSVLQSNNPNIGLLFGRHGLMRGLRPPIYTLLSSPSLKLGLKRILPFQHLICDFTNIDVSQTSEGFCLTIECIKSGEVHYASVDAWLSGIVSLVRWILQSSVNPLKVTLKHSCYSGIEDYTNAFRCPVEFDKERNSVLFSRDDFEEPIPTSDAGLTLYYERIMSSDLEKSQLMDLKDFVKSEIIKNLPNGSPGIELIASKQYMTGRTLQRRLKSEGVVFKDLLDSCRQDLAVEYLCHGIISIEKIAIELGFSEASSFVRAFKRWFNQTPGEYRDNKVCNS